jgi:hypothetical protein
MVLQSAQLIVDTRNAIAGRHGHVFKLGAPSPAGDLRPEAPFEDLASTEVVA